MKEVLCIAFSCPPILDPQSILLAKMLGPLRERGFRVQVLGLDPETCITRTDESLNRLLPPDPEPLRVPASERRLWWRAVSRCLPSVVHLPDKHFPAILRAVKAGVALHARRPVGLLFSWAQYHSCSLVALRLKKILDLPWVAHFSDPWRASPYPRRTIHERWINAKLEEAVIAAADAVVFVNEETLDSTMARYPRAWREKTAVIPHCFDPHLYPSKTSAHAGMVIRHIGNFYGHRGPGRLLEAIARLRGADESYLQGVRLEFVGGVGPAQGKEVQQLGLGQVVHFRPAVAYLESLREMREADVLLLVEDATTRNLFLPSKLIDYLGAGRPVFAITATSGPAARLLTDTGDVVVPPDDVDGIASALRRCIGRFHLGELSDFRRSPESIAPFHSRTTVSALGSLFNQVLQRRTWEGSRLLDAGQ